LNGSTAIPSARKSGGTSVNTVILTKEIISSSKRHWRLTRHWQTVHIVEMNMNGARTKGWVGHSDRDGSHVQNMVKYRLVTHEESDEFLRSIQGQISSISKLE
jgi:hypothetical protein